MPSWLENGLYETFANAKAKGSKVTFDTPAWRSRAAGESSQADQLSPVKRLVTEVQNEYQFGRTSQPGALVRFLLVGTRSQEQEDP